MSKLQKQYYFSSNGERKVNCYKINVPKDILKKTDIEEEDELNIYVKDKRIIVERVKKGNLSNN